MGEGNQWAPRNAENCGHLGLTPPPLPQQLLEGGGTQRAELLVGAWVAPSFFNGKGS